MIDSAEVRRLKQENGAQRIRIRQLEMELAEAKASAATADGIAAQVFNAIQFALGDSRRAMLAVFTSASQADA